MNNFRRFNEYNVEGIQFVIALSRLYFDCKKTIYNQSKPHLTRVGSTIILVRSYLSSVLIPFDTQFCPPPIHPGKQLPSKNKPQMLRPLFKRTAVRIGKNAAMQSVFGFCNWTLRPSSKFSLLSFHHGPPAAFFASIDHNYDSQSSLFTGCHI